MGYKFSIEDLRTKFNEFNAMYFDGMLDGSRITFKRTLTRRRFGSTGLKYKVKSCREYIVSISGYYDRSEWDIDETLLHEMIHVWQRDVYGKWNHGVTFKAKAAEINKKSGHHISRLGSSVGVDLSAEAKTKVRNSIEYVLTYDYKGQKRISWVSKVSVPDIIKWHDTIVSNIEMYQVDGTFVRKYTDNRKRSGRLSTKDFDKLGEKSLMKKGIKIAI